MTGWRKRIAAVAGLALVAAVAAPSMASAQQTHAQAQGAAATTEAAVEAKSPNTGRVSLGLGADWVSAYYFRGIANVQNGGSNVQPYAEIGFKLLDTVGPLNSLVLTPGIWNNFQYGDGTLSPRLQARDLPFTRSHALRSPGRPLLCSSCFRPV